MRLLICILLLCFIGCSENDSPEEIKVRKNEAGNINHSQTEFNNSNDNDSSESKSSGENSSLQKITSKEVNRHIGDSLKITGYIADVYLGEKVAYLNFENKFPKNVFSCAIFPGKFDEFGDLSKYKNKTAEVTGKITTYKNKPQIILESKEQIKIIQ